MPDQEPRRLLLCIAEPISSWIDKGEVVDRYYNPGDLFDEVHLLLANDDAPDPDAVRRLVGRARYEIHNLPTPRLSFLWTLGWRPSLLRVWTRKGVAIARQVRPHLVRCHGASLNALIAREVNRELGVPYAVSMHINPDEDLRNRARTWKSWLQTHGLARTERVTLRDADVVLPVYEPIVPYLRRLGVEQIVVVYNVLNGANLTTKRSYAISGSAKVISIGRQFESKDPSHLVRALVDLPDVELTLVGDGPLHDGLGPLAAACGVGDRVTLRRAVPNDELCRMLPTFDIAAIHSEYWELSKAEIEILLAGLPLVVNRRQGAPVPELTDDLVRYVDADAASYAAAIRSLVDDDEARRKLGEHAAAHAAEHWAPARTEAAVVAVYERLLDGHAAVR